MSNISSSRNEEKQLSAFIYGGIHTTWRGVSYSAADFVTDSNVLSRSTEK